MFGLCEYKPYKIRVSVSLSLPAVEENIDFVSTEVHRDRYRVNLWSGIELILIL